MSGDSVSSLGQRRAGQDRHCVSLASVVTRPALVSGCVCPSVRRPSSTAPSTRHKDGVGSSSAWCGRERKDGSRGPGRWPALGSAARRPPRRTGERVWVWARAGGGGRVAHFTSEEMEADNGELPSVTSQGGQAGTLNCPSGSTAVPSLSKGALGSSSPCLAVLLPTPVDVATLSAATSSVGAEMGASPLTVPRLQGLSGLDAPCTTGGRRSDPP